MNIKTRFVGDLLFEITWEDGQFQFKETLNIAEASTFYEDLIELREDLEKFIESASKHMKIKEKQ